MHAPYPMMAPPALLGGASEEGRWKIASLGEAVDAAISDTLGALLALRDLVLYPIWQLAFLDHPFVLSIADRLLAVFALGTSDGIAGDVGLFLRLAGLAFVLALLHRTGAPLSTKLLLVGVAMGPSLLGLSPAPAHVLALTRGVLLGFVFVAGASFQPAAWREAPAYPLAAWLLAGALGLFIVLIGSESGLSPAGLGAAGEQAFIAVTVLLTIVVPLPENIRRWRGRRATSAPPSQRQSPNVADGAIGDRPSQIHPGSVLRRRAAHYLLRRHPALSGATPSMHDSALGIMTVGYGAPAEGLQLRQLEKWLLLRYELTILCVWRGDVVLLPGEAGCCLREGDRVIVSGRREHVAESRHLFHSIRPGMR